MELAYSVEGEGDALLLLHGWGCDRNIWKATAEVLRHHFMVVAVDFAGFGKSQEPREVWGVEEYTRSIEALVKELGVVRPIVVGHSFGGKVALLYASKYEVEKLILFGSPCIRIEEPLPLTVRILKKLKKLPGLNEFGEFMKQYIGSRDYKAATPIMRQTLVEVVNEDLSKFAREIEEPTLLIWGENDTEAPLNEAKELEKIMNDAALIVLPGTHYAYLENLPQVVNILNSFFGG